MRQTEVYYLRLLTIHYYRMNRLLSIKLKKIFLPYVLMYVGLLLGYMALHWMMDSIHATERMSGVLFIDYWMVLIAPAIVAIAFMRKRMRLLKTGAGYIYFVAIAYLLLQMPIQYAAEFIYQAPYKLHHVETVGEINPRKVERFYKIDHFKLLTNNTPSTMTRAMEDDLVTYSMLLPIPMVDSIKRSRFYKLKVFYAQEYTLALPRKGLPPFYYEYRRQSFEDSATKDFDRFSPGRDCYYERVDASSEKQIYVGLIKHTYHVKGKPYLLKPVYEPFADRYKEPLRDMLLYFGIGTLGFLILILIPKVDVYAYKRITKDYYTDYEEDEDVVVVKSRGLAQFFIPQRDALTMTPILINLNIIYFVLLVLTGYSAWGLSVNGLDIFGGFRYETVVQDGEYWRLLLGTFLHHDVVHLFSNMLFLAAAGVLLERVIGKWTFLLVYLSCAVVASVGSIFYNEHLVSAGASGAVMGLYGVMLPMVLVGVLPKAYLRVNIFIMVFELVTGVIMNTGGDVDVAAHVSGYLFGAAIGAIVAIVIRERRQTVTFTRNNYYEVEEQQVVASAGAYLLDEEEKQPNDNDNPVTPQ